MTPGVVYLANGRLFLKDGNGPATAMESQFAQSIRERAFELNRRHAWKTEGRGAKFMMSGGALWGAEDPMQIRIQIMGICRGVKDSDLYYSLQSPEISGVLLLKNGGATEQRLLHTSDFRVGHIAAQSGTGRLAMSIQHRGGSTIAVMGSDGSGFAEVTQGESVDDSPHWYPNEENRIVFQSAGLAMNEHGQYTGRGPAAIQSLDLETGAMQCLAEDARFDFLGPQIGTDGALYFIRRPYRDAQPRFHLLRLLEDILLFPFRLIYAFFQFLNFFSMMYTGKPLSKPSGNSQQRYANMPKHDDLGKSDRGPEKRDEDQRRGRRARSSLLGIMPEAHRWKHRGIGEGSPVIRFGAGWPCGVFERRRDLASRCRRSDNEATQGCNDPAGHCRACGSAGVAASGS